MKEHKNRNAAREKRKLCLSVHFSTFTQIKPLKIKMSAFPTKLASARDSCQIHTLYKAQNVLKNRRKINKPKNRKAANLLLWKERLAFISINTNESFILACVALIRAGCTGFSRHYRGCVNTDHKVHLNGCTKPLGAAIPAAEQIFVPYSYLLLLKTNSKPKTKQFCTEYLMERSLKMSIFSRWIEYLFPINLFILVKINVKPVCAALNWDNFYHPGRFIPPGTFTSSLAMELVGSLVLGKLMHKLNTLDWSPWEWQKGKGEEERKKRQRNCYRNWIQSCFLSGRKSPAKEKPGHKISWKMIGNFWKSSRFCELSKSIVKTQLPPTLTMGMKSIFWTLKNVQRSHQKTFKFKA